MLRSTYKRYNLLNAFIYKQKHYIYSLALYCANLQEDKGRKTEILVNQGKIIVISSPISASD